MQLSFQEQNYGVRQQGGSQQDFAVLSIGGTASMWLTKNGNMGESLLDMRHLGL
jgi:hypothetical protein